MKYPSNAQKIHTYENLFVVVLNIVKAIAFISIDTSVHRPINVAVINHPLIHLGGLIVHY